MKIIKQLEEKIEYEVQDAHEYAMLALEYKESCPETAELFYKLSCEEMTHMEILHRDVVRHIDRYRQKHGEAPEAMKAVYDYLHKRQIEASARVSNLQAQYKK